MYLFTISANSQKDLENKILEKANEIKNIEVNYDNIKQEILEDLHKSFDAVIGTHTHEIAKNSLSIDQFNNKLETSINKVLSNVDNQIASLSIPNQDNLKQTMEAMRNNLLGHISAINQRIDKIPTETNSLWTKGLFLTYQKDSSTYTQMELLYYEAKTKTIIDNKEKITETKIIPNFPNSTFIKNV